MQSSDVALRTNVQSHFFDGVVGVFLTLTSLHANMASEVSVGPARAWHA